MIMILFLTKKVKVPYTKKYDTDEIEEDTNKWKRGPCSGTGGVNIAKISIPPKALYKFNAIPFNSKSISHRNGKKNLKFVLNHKRPRLIKTILTKNKSGSTILLYFKLKLQ